MKKQSYPRKVGEDRIFRRGDRLIVCSKVDMEEWQIRENRKTAVFVDDEVWCLVEKQFTDGKEVRYILDPWPDYSRHIPGRKIRYDEEYVQACKELDKKRKIESRYGPFLNLFKGPAAVRKLQGIGQDFRFLLGQSFFLEEESFATHSKLRNRFD